MTGTQCKRNLYKELSEIIKNPEFLRMKIATEKNTFIVFNSK